MDAPDVNPPTPDLPTPDARTGFADLWESHRYALITLGGLALLAVVLGSTARRRGVLPGGRRYEPGPLERQIQVNADWEASLRHFAAAVDLRCQGMQQQLDSIHQALGTEGPATHPSATVSPNGSAPNVTYEAAIADQPENVAPGPAAVSEP